MQVQVIPPPRSPTLPPREVKPVSSSVVQQRFFPGQLPYNRWAVEGDQLGQKPQRPQQKQQLQGQQQLLAQHQQQRAYSMNLSAREAPFRPATIAVPVTVSSASQRTTSYEPPRSRDPYLQFGASSRSRSNGPVRQLQSFIVEPVQNVVSGGGSKTPVYGGGIHNIISSVATPQRHRQPVHSHGLQFVPSGALSVSVPPSFVAPTMFKEPHPTSLCSTVTRVTQAQHVLTVHHPLSPQAGSSDGGLAAKLKMMVTDEVKAEVASQLANQQSQQYLQTHQPRLSRVSQTGNQMDPQIQRIETELKQALEQVIVEKDSRARDQQCFEEKLADCEAAAAQEREQREQEKNKYDREMTSQQTKWENEVRNLAESCRKHQEANRNLEGKCRILESSESSMKARVADKEKKVETLERERKEIDRERKELRLEVARLQSEAQTSSSEIEVRLREEIDINRSLTEQINHLTQEYHSQLEVLQRELDALRDSKFLRASPAEARKMIAQAIPIDSNALQDEISDLRAEISLLQARLAKQHEV